MKPLTTLEEMESVLRAEGPLLVLKHSRVCPVSFGAHREVQDWIDSGRAVPVHLVVVQEARPVSNALAERLGIRHESPQAILLDKGKVLWHASHGEITEAALEEARGKP